MSGRDRSGTPQRKGKRGGARSIADSPRPPKERYTYTSAGSMAKDLNKGISTITYNILNKPQVVTYSGTPTKTVTYTYDASGVKIKAVTVANSVTTTTDYIGGFVYTNNVLSFFSSPEGRVVKNGSNYEYQYAIADHQGNTRVMFTSAAPVAQPVSATMEATSNANFQNYVNRSGFALFNRTAGGTTSQLLNGGVNGRVGLAKTYRIYAGDKVKIEAYGKYTNATSTGSNLSGFASALLAAYSLPVPVGWETGTPSAALNTWGGLVAGGSGGSGTVKAFVNIIVFDKNYKLIDFMWDGINPAANQVGATPIIAHDYMVREYTAKEESIVYMYVSNESPTLVDVYFDDVTMTYTPSNILQYNEYYPFGLSTANSWTRENTTGNNFLYNGGTELNTTTQVYDLHYRNYDPVLGRMNQVDPVASKYASHTPYNYAFNSPAVMNDPLGDESVTGGKAYCSWCYTKSRPIDTGTAGGGGGSGGGGVTRNGNEFTIDFNKMGQYGGTWNNQNGYHDYSESEAWMAAIDHANMYGIKLSLPGGGNTNGSRMMMFHVWAGKQVSATRYKGQWVRFDPYIAQLMVKKGYSLKFSSDLAQDDQRRLHPDLLNTHSAEGEKVYTIDDFIKENKGKTLGDIINQRDPQRFFGIPLASGGPEIRFIVDPYDPSSGAIIDLRHLTIIGSYTPSFGNAVESLQSSFFPNGGGGDMQDYFSNNLGYAFTQQYGQQISQSPTNYATYLGQFLTNRSSSGYIYVDGK